MHLAHVDCDAFDAAIEKRDNPALKDRPVVVRPDMDKYVRAGHEVRATMEALSIDEAFLDLAGIGKLHGLPPALVLARFSRQVETESGITVSAGPSCCKFQGA